MKYPRASRALRWALDPMLKRARFARTTLLRTVGNLGLSRSGAPPDQILDPLLCIQYKFRTYQRYVETFIVELYPVQISMASHGKIMMTMFIICLPVFYDEALLFDTIFYPLVIVKVTGVSQRTIVQNTTDVN